MTDKFQITFIGTGSMGKPMVHELLKHGYPSSRGTITDHPSIQHGTGHGIGLDLHEQMERIYQDVPLDSIPWNLAEPPQLLVEAVRTGKIKPCKAVDLGCGAGNYAVWLAGKGFDITGIDISRQAIPVGAGHLQQFDVATNLHLFDEAAAPLADGCDQRLLGLEQRANRRHEARRQALHFANLIYEVDRAVLVWREGDCGEMIQRTHVHPVFADPPAVGDIDMSDDSFGAVKADQTEAAPDALLAQLHCAKATNSRFAQSPGHLAHHGGLSNARDASDEQDVGHGLVLSSTKLSGDGARPIDGYHSL